MRSALNETILQQSQLNRIRNQKTKKMDKRKHFNQKEEIDLRGIRKTDLGFPRPTLHSLDLSLSKIGNQSNLMIEDLEDSIENKMKGRIATVALSFLCVQL